MIQFSVIAEMSEICTIQTD